MKSSLPCPRRAGIVALALAIAIAPALSLAQQSGFPAPLPTAARPWPGGFQPGDRIILSVEGEKQLTDTFVVRAGPAVDLPLIGIIPLSGVRREGIEPYLTGVIAKFVRDPIVRAQSLIRVGVIGEVVNPGFYVLRADAVISDALTSAGGLTRDSRVDRFHVDRDGVTTIDKGPLMQALTRGATLGELGVEPGDQFIIPRKPDADHTLRWLGVLVAVPAAIYTGMLLFGHNR